MTEKEKVIDPGKTLEEGTRPARKLAKYAIKRSLEKSGSPSVLQEILRNILRRD